MRKVSCNHCGSTIIKPTGHYNRSKRIKAKFFCNIKCSGESKRKDLTIEQKKETKRLYDAEYRRKNIEILKKKKIDYFAKDYATNPEKYREIRKKRMSKHVEYCRQPTYKNKKHAYDRKRYAQRSFGEAWEIHVIAMQITEEAQKQQSKFEMMQSKGTINKAQKRKREYAKTKCG